MKDTTDKSIHKKDKITHKKDKTDNHTHKKDKTDKNTEKDKIDGKVLLLRYIGILYSTGEHQGL